LLRCETPRLTAANGGYAMRVLSITIATAVLALSMSAATAASNAKGSNAFAKGDVGAYCVAHCTEKQKTGATASYGRCVNRCYANQSQKQ
jgi:hypothetical protein